MVERHLIRRGMRGRYLVQNPLLVGALTVNDAWGAFSRRAKPVGVGDHFDRMVVGINGHVGDGLLALWPLARLRAVFPGARIACVGPSWLEPIMKPAGLLDEFHPVDHWRVSRRAESLWHKWSRYRTQAAEALCRLRASEYHAALDLYFHFPNHAKLLAAARIPVRLGFASGGNGPWFSQARGFTGGERHGVDHQNELVDQLIRWAGRDLPGRITPAYAVGDIVAVNLPANYVLVHPGTGAIQREWPEESWSSVVTWLAGSGLRLVFTGRGPRERDLNRRLATLAPGSTDLSDRLDWLQLAAVVRGASAVLGVESMIGHLASLFERPTVSIYCGINPVERWRPVGAKATALQHPVPCSPCNRSSGCAGMECVRGVTPAQVLAALADRTGGTIGRTTA